MEYNYNPYETTNTEPPKEKSSFAGFGATLIKVVAIALVFGLVSGSTFLLVLKIGAEPSAAKPGVEKEQTLEKESEKAEKT